MLREGPCLGGSAALLGGRPGGTFVFPRLQRVSPFLRGLLGRFKTAVKTTPGLRPVVEQLAERFRKSKAKPAGFTG